MTGKRAGRVPGVLLLAGFAASFVAAVGAAALLRGGREAPASDRRSAAVVPTDTPRPPRTSGDGAIPPAPLEPVKPEATELKTLKKTLHGLAGFREKADALKRAIKPGVDPTLATFEVVLKEGPGELREVALRLLIDAAATREAARRLLLSFAGSRDATDPYRLPALAAVLRYGADAEVAACSDLIFRETDPESVAAAARALTGNPCSEAQSLLLSVTSSHPSEGARHRAEEERTGSYCPDHAPGPAEE